VQDLWRPCGDPGLFLQRLPPPYSSEIQQPMRTTATLGRHRHTFRAAPFDRHQDRADSLNPEGQGFESP